MSEQASTPAPPLDPLHGELRDLIAASRQRLAATVNAELTRLYWRIGQRLASEVLRGERARYGAQLMDHLGERLAGEFGRGFGMTETFAVPSLDFSETAQGIELKLDVPGYTESELTVTVL